MTASRARPEAIRLELFTQRFHPSRPGHGASALERTAVSTNVKERLDFSCALLDREGELVVNAPHIPVHLVGASASAFGGYAIRCRWLRETSLVTNHPSFGGSHLPDVTVVTPGLHPVTTTESPLAYVASRAHHAEIGGSRPGIDAAGCTAPWPKRASCYRRATSFEAASRAGTRFATGWSKRPTLPQRRRQSRRPCAQRWRRTIAGALALLALVESARRLDARALHGPAEATRRASASVKRWPRFPTGATGRPKCWTTGAPLSVRVDIEGDGARIDFSGSAGVHEGNLNATPAGRAERV